MKKQEKLSNKIWLDSDRGCQINCATSVQRVENGVKIVDTMNTIKVISNSEWETFSEKIIKDREIHTSYLTGLYLSNYEINELAFFIEKELI